MRGVLAGASAEATHGRGGAVHTVALRARIPHTRAPEIGKGGASELGALPGGKLGDRGGRPPALRSRRTSFLQLEAPSSLAPPREMVELLEANEREPAGDAGGRGRRGLEAPGAALRGGGAALGLRERVVLRPARRAQHRGHERRARPHAVHRRRGHPPGGRGSDGRGARAGRTATDAGGARNRVDKLLAARRQHGAAAWLQLAPAARMLVTSHEWRCVRSGEIWMKRRWSRSARPRRAQPLAGARRRRRRRREPLHGARPQAVEEGVRPLPEEQERAIAAMVRRVRGVPLAIELCASRFSAGEPPARPRHPPGALSANASKTPSPGAFAELNPMEREALVPCSVFRGEASPWKPAERVEIALPSPD